jgi:hypothetical protein
VQVNLSSLATAVQIVGDTASTALFAIAHEAPGTDHEHSTDTFGSFGDFVAALSTALDGMNTVEHVVAEGTFNSSTAVFTATHMVIVLEN